MVIISLPTFTRVGEISLQESEIQVNAVCVDYAANTAYYTLNSNRIAVNMVTFQRSATSNLINTAATAGTAFSVTAIIDGANLYFGLSFGHIVKTSKADVNTAIGTVPRIQNAGSDVTIPGFGVDTGNFLYGAPAISKTTRLSVTNLNFIDSYTWINNNGQNLRPYSSH